MIPHAVTSTFGSLSSTITALGAPVANHLWQSTLFAVVAGLLTIALRKNRAETRYWLWLVASLKFLLPFSVLVALGSHFAWTKAASVSQPAVSLVIQQVSAPFGSVVSNRAATLTPSLAAASISHAFPLFLALIWALGCAAILFTWMFRWLRLANTVRGATPITTGREVEILDRLARNTGSQHPRVVATSSTLEPGIVGIFRPVLLLPEGIADRLSDAQLESVFAHELCHVRRRDNLAAAVHMFVEAIFWFHPLLWWMGARLIDERERACDEGVLQLGSDPQSYAEGILKVCEFYLESPLVCAAGVTGSNLKKRIEAIMIQRITSKLNFGRKLLLSAAAAAALLIPVSIGLLNPPPSRAQSAASAGMGVVSITPSLVAANPVVHIETQEHERGNAPSDFHATGITLAQLIAVAYGVNNSQVTGGPDWVTTAKFDVSVVEPKAGLAIPDVQAALANQFKLAFHRESTEATTYDLTVAPGGPKLTQAATTNGPTPSRLDIVGGNPPHEGFMLYTPDDHLIANGISMSSLASTLSHQMGRVVTDKTGLTGLYDFSLEWKVSPGDAALQSNATSGSAPSANYVAAVVAALPEQLGLQLTQQSGQVDTLVIDYAEQPPVSN